ncbi:MAG: NAD-dependent DNA ligase LigA, partial [Lachnospiraceae bacterium]|nr:NAD-dependent DNA ligase LigA [Lachnospiraceae bacterium]
MKTDKIMRMKELINEIREEDIAYYKYDDPKLTDREYDLLVAELMDLEAETGVILSDSPTQKVSGEILEGLMPVQHTKPMLSADKTKSVEDLVRFAKDRDVLLSWKLDGLTLVLRYADGKFKQAITRGKDGIIGEDVTHTVKHFLNVPLSVPSKETFEVRGEGVISWENFHKINAELPEPYRHPRGLAAGSVRKLDSEDFRERRVEFIAFELILEHEKYDSKASHFAYLKENGFDVVENVYIEHDATAEQIRDQVAAFDAAAFAYPADGLIMEYADIAYGKSLGATGHHENRLIALKWQDELYDTKFIGLETAVTRNGMVSLTGLFEPVEIDGTVVERAYLHNIDILEKLQ